MPDEDRTSEGRFIVRPEGAAELFDSKRGQLAARKRWAEKEAIHREQLRTLVAAKKGVNPDELTFDEAFSLVAMDPLVRKALAESIPAIKLLAHLTGELPDVSDAKVVQDQRQVHFNVYNFDNRGKALQFVEDLKEAGQVFAAAEVQAQIPEDEGPIEVRVPLNQ